MDDKQRAAELGMTLEQFQSLVGEDPGNVFGEFMKTNDGDKKKKKGKDKDDKSGKDKKASTKKKGY